MLRHYTKVVLYIRTMKKILKYSYVVIFTLLLDVMAFAAEEPGDFGDTDDTNPTDTPVPIDGYLLWLTIIAIAFAFFVINRRRTAQLK